MNKTCEYCGKKLEKTVHPTTGTEYNNLKKRFCDAECSRLNRQKRNKSRGDIRKEMKIIKNRKHYCRRCKDLIIGKSWNARYCIKCVKKNKYYYVKRKKA